MKLLTTREVADRLDAPLNTVLSWCRKGYLEGAQKIGCGRRGRWAIPESALEDFEPPRMGRPPKGGGA